MNAENPEYWLSLVEEDIATAKALLRSRRYVHMAFFCHLSAECVLKAAIAAPGVIPPRVHGLLRLSEKGGVLGSLDESQLMLLSALQPLQLEGRYPEAQEALVGMLDNAYSTDLLKRTEAFCAWMKEWIKIRQ